MNGRAATLIAAFLTAACAATGTRGPEARVAIDATTVADFPPGSAFRECDACPEMVVLPAGEFNMGSEPCESTRHVCQRRSDEDPVHAVSISSAFAVSRFEVTRAEWAACAADGICTPLDDEDADGRLPATHVSWRDAIRFTQWLNLVSDDRAYRLLTEAEWEYAARAGTATRFSWGDDPPSCDVSSPNGAIHADCGMEGPRPVGEAPPNAFGLYDMHGNVQEWVFDCYVRGYGAAPTDGSAVSGEHCRLRGVRGGWWDSELISLRSANRGGFRPDAHYETLGLRVARDLPG